MLTNQEHPFWIKNFIDVYSQLSIENLHLLNQVYSDDVIFIDPMHRIQGIENLGEYFRALYQNLTSCQFDIQEVIVLNDEAAIYWQMTYQHAKLNKGAPIVVDGHSHIKNIQDEITYHRDYLDLGAMLYEHLPLIGSLTKWVKSKAAK